MARNKVSRCICHKRSFEEIREHAREEGYDSVDELKEEDYCSRGCGLCEPYVEMVLETGETEFEPGAFYRRKRK